MAVVKRVVVTGASGFIGRHALTPLIAAGFEVHAISSRANMSAMNQDGVHWHQLDLLKSADLDFLLASIRPTHLLHLAWYAEPGRFWTASANLDWVSATLSLLQAFARHGGQRVVMAGTCAEYDWSDGRCYESTTALQPATLYGVCKNATRQIIERFCEQHQISSAWGRIFFLYGEHEHPARLVSSVISSLLKGEEALCSAGTQRRDFLHVSDVASAFVTLLDSDVQGAVNIASGEGLAIKDVVIRIAQKLDQDNLVRLGARPTPPGDPELLVADIARLRDEVKWTPTLSLDAGLDQTIAWWRHELHGP